jgi:hypothetical protein
MRFLFVVLFFVLRFWDPLFSQDILYTATGSKLKAKVVEINTKDIKYKDYANIDGPTYVIAKTDIVLISYSNGSTEIINPDAPALLPKKAEPAPVVSETRPRVPEKSKKSIYYLNPNLLSINALALANGDVTLMYDREFANQHVGLTVLGGYNFNSRMGALNAAIFDSRDGAKKNYDVGLGINLMPKTTKRVQYFAGILGKYMSYNYKNIIDTTNNQLKYENAKGFQLAIMITQGWTYRISPNFNFKLFGAFGIPVNYPQLNYYSTSSSGRIVNPYRSLPKIYIGYCFGYRF